LGALPLSEAPVRIRIPHTGPHSDLMTSNRRHKGEGVLILGV